MQLHEGDELRHRDEQVAVVELAARRELLRLVAADERGRRVGLEALDDQVGLVRGLEQGVLAQDGDVSVVGDGRRGVRVGGDGRGGEHAREAREVDARGGERGDERRRPDRMLEDLAPDPQPAVRRDDVHRVGHGGGAGARGCGRAPRRRFAALDWARGGRARLRPGRFAWSARRVDGATGAAGAAELDVPIVPAQIPALVPSRIRKMLGLVADILCYCMASSFHTCHSSLQYVANYSNN